jgi:hypothetical protein
MPRGFVPLWLILLVLVAAFIRVHGANDYAYNPDEAMLTEIASGKDIKDVWQYSLYESHPPLGNFLRHYWMEISDDPRFVRAESLLFGLSAILLYYFIGRILGGELAGLCCALIVVFSRGCVIQSYVARNYIFFFLFISACFYCFLHWRRHHRVFALAGYAMFGCLAGATHFSAVFTVSCIGACEGAAMLLRGAKAKEWALWIAANAVIAVCVGTLYFIWLPMLKQLALYFSSASLGWGTRIKIMLLYPLGIPLYLFPGIASAIPLACGFAALAVRPGSIAREAGEFRFLLALMALGLALAMALYITDIYTPVGGRHNFWIFPFIISAAGWLLSDICLAASRRLGRFSWLATIMLLGGWGALYNARDRFADASEYSMTNAHHAAVERFFNGLGPRDLIIMERDDAVMFEDIYPLLGSAPYTGDPRAALAPHLHTHILYDPFFRRMYEKNILLEMFRQAQAKRMLDGVDWLAFFYSLWPHSIAAQLMLCPALDKKVVVFLPMPGRLAKGDDIHQARAALMLVSKQSFVTDVLAPGGRAHACLESGPDALPP